MDWGLGRSQQQLYRQGGAVGAGVWSLLHQRSREGGEGTSQLQPAETAGGSCLQLSEHWGRDLGSCLYTTIQPLGALTRINFGPTQLGRAGAAALGLWSARALLEGITSAWWSTQSRWIWGLTRNCHADMPFLSRGKCLGLRYPGF